MPGIVDIEEESKKYEDEWVLFEVTEVNEIDVPVKGRLLHHCKGRDEMDREAMKARDKDNYVFFTGEPVPPHVYVAL